MLAHVDRSRGRTGEVLTSGHSREPGWYTGKSITLLPAGRPMRIVHAWVHDGRLVVKFEGIDSIGDAETLRGQQIAIPKAEREAPAVGEYYYADLVGCTLIEAETGESCGIVSAWYETGGPVLLEAGSMLVPFVPAICLHVDLELKQIRVRLPEGLRELNP